MTLRTASIFTVVLLSGGMLGACADKTANVPTGRDSRWNAIAQLPDFWTGTWQGSFTFTDPPNMGDPPMKLSYTPQAQAYIDSYKPILDIPFAGKDCKTPGMPFVMQIASAPIKFMVEPEMIAIYIEGHSQTRFIHMNTKHPEHVNPTYLGHSVGHWEGDTLVVDTVSFLDETILQYGTRKAAKEEGEFLMIGFVFGPHGPNLHMVERMRLIDPNTLQIKMSIFDDTVFTSAYETTRTWKRQTGPGSEPMEWVCSGTPEYYDPATNEYVEPSPEEMLKMTE